jgi:prephenate dehydratase
MATDRAHDAHATSGAGTIAFFGPFGTFTEQALRTQPDLVSARTRRRMRTVPDVLDAVSSGQVDAGFVPIENSIEGMVNFTLDALAFDHELLITREVVLDIEHCLLAKPGTALADVVEVLFDPGRHRAVSPVRPRALATGRGPGGELDRRRGADRGRGGRRRGCGDRTAGRGGALRARGASPGTIADHPGNQTRFVLIPATGCPGRRVTTAPRS